MAKKTKWLQVRLDEETRKELEDLAKNDARTMSNVVVILIHHAHKRGKIRDEGTVKEETEKQTI